MADTILARELVEYTKYDKLLEWQVLIPWINNFAQKKAKRVFSQPRAEKALGDYVARRAYQGYAGKRAAEGIRIDASTKLLFGKFLLRNLMPRINRTAEKMKKVGLNKGRLVKRHPVYPYTSGYNI